MLVRASCCALLAAALATGSFAQSQFLTTEDGSSVLTYRTDPILGLVIEAVGDAQDPAAIAFAPSELWQLEFQSPLGCAIVGPASLSDHEFELETDGTSLTAEWDGATTPFLPGESFNVTIDVEAEGDHGEFEATIHVKTDTPNSALFRVRFPCLDAQVTGPDSVMSAPIAHGVLLPNPAQNVTLVGPSKLNAFLPPCDPFTLVEPGLLSMQWWSLYDQADPTGALLFFGTKDRDGYRKEWMFDPLPLGPAADRLRLVLRHVPEDNITPDIDYAQPYPFTFRALRGDWYDAAQHYRNWALDQSWTAQGPIGENPDFSAIVRDSKMLGVTQPTFGPDDPATPCPIDPDWAQFVHWPAETASQRAAFGVDKITPRIFFWDFNSFTRDIGDWFPIRPEVIAAGNTLRAQGDDYSAYFNSLRYSTRIPSYLQSYVPDSVNGGLYGWVEDFGIVNDNLQRSFATGVACPVGPVFVPFLEVCQATRFAADYSAFVARQLNDQAGSRGLYLDVLTGTDVRLCYDPSHGHPVGGGSYYTEGIEAVLQRVRDAMRNDPTHPVAGYFTQSEGASEHFLPYLETVQGQLTWTRTETFCDLFTATCPRNGTDFLVVPLWETVYHEFQMTNATLQLNAPRLLPGPLGIPILLDPFFMRVLRNIFAAHVQLGLTPFAGSILSADLTTDNANPALFPDYFVLVDTVQRFMSVLSLDEVRDFTTFGPRLRDPVLTRAAAPAVPLTRVPFDTPPFSHSWLAGGRLQPFVYASAYGRGKNDFAPSGVDLDDAAMGILLLNWSDPLDNLFFGTPDAGTSTVRVTFDPSEVEPAATAYTVIQVSPGGETQLDAGPVSGPISTDVTVPARTAVFLRVELD